MGEVVVFAIVGAIVGAGAGLLVLRWDRRRFRRRTGKATGVRMEECEACPTNPTPLWPSDEAHHVVATYDAPDGGDGGTAMVATFCAEHCPGGCDRGCVASVL